MNNKIIEAALSEYGVQEIPGDAENQRILQYFAQIGHGWNKTEETAWCSCFANWVLKQSGDEGSGKLNARSWLEWGTKVEEPEIGDVVIFWRSSRESWKGHVGFYISKDENYIYTLGGNQNNCVCIKPYSIERLLGFRRAE